MQEEKEKMFSQGFDAFAPFLGERKTLIISLFVLLLLVVAAIGLTTRLGATLQERSETQRQIAEMENFVRDYQKQSAEVANFPKTIVLRKDLDKVQSNVMRKIQSMKLNLVSMREEVKDSGTHGRIFIANFEGSYENTMMFLHSLHEHDNLITIKELSTEITGGMMRTTLTYKIYCQEEGEAS